MDSSITCPLPEPTLRAFTVPGHPRYGHVSLNFHHRGDLTQACEDRLRLQLGEDAYAHLHWDTVVCSGDVYLCIPRYRHPEGRDVPGLALSAVYHWCLSHADEDEDIDPASTRAINRVAKAGREQAESLPGLEWLHMAKIAYWQYSGRTPKRKHKPAPKDVLFFRFTGGVGCARFKTP